MTDNPTLGASMPRSESTALPPSGKHSLSPFAIIALSSLGAFIGLALVFNATRFGSVGRYQLVANSSGSTVIRMDTTTGELSLCYGLSLVRPKCLPWGHDDQPFKTISKPAPAGEQGGGE